MLFCSILGNTWDTAGGQPLYHVDTCQVQSQLAQNLNVVRSTGVCLSRNAGMIKMC
jgi:hypothetical protein